MAWEYSMSCKLHGLLAASRTARSDKVVLEIFTDVTKSYTDSATDGQCYKAHLAF